MSDQQIRSIEAMSREELIEEVKRLRENEAQGGNLSGEPMGVPTDGDIMWEWANTPNTGDMRVDLVTFARTLLARYGNSDQPDK